MSVCNLPFVLCRLTDKDGKLADPYKSGSITYTVLCSPKEDGGLQGGLPYENRDLLVRISGYITVFIQGKDLSQPFPFSIYQTVTVCAPPCSYPVFSVAAFRCHGEPVMNKDETALERVDIYIEIVTAVRLCADVDVKVRAVIPPCPEEREICIIARRVLGCTCFTGCTHIVYELLLRAMSSQYNALSDGMQRSYTDGDELTQYGHVGILAPENVSWHDLFINAMLQPGTTYALSAGHLDILTDNAPLAGASVIIAYLLFEENQGRRVTMSNEYYVTESTGTRRVYTNADAILTYGDKGIPAPGEVSFFNLYVNGSLQPAANYTVEENHLELNTSDLPQAGAMLTLESLIIRDSAGKKLDAEIYQYNAVSDGQKIYTDSDEIRAYGDKGISDPADNTYLHLFVNGVLQPPVTYTVRRGILILDTLDAPIEGAPVTLQFVRIYKS